MDLNARTPHSEGEASASRFPELSRRLDDLRGLGILMTGTPAAPLQDEDQLVRLCMHMADALEATQRRVIETSIQLLSLRELMAKLLSLRTPEAVGGTVAVYLQKAFDYERVLVALHDPEEDGLRGWVATEAARCQPFSLQGEWSGALRECLRTKRPVGEGDPQAEATLVEGNLPRELLPFRTAEIGAFHVYPLRGRGNQDGRPAGVLAVGRRAGGDLAGLDTGLLESVVEAAGTAVENLRLEEDARREEAFRHDIMQNMVAGLVAVDRDGRILTMNAQAEAMTGRSLTELRGTIPGGDVLGGEIPELLERAMRSGRSVARVERALRRADGTCVPVACSTSLLRNPEGDIYGAVVTFDDLTEIKAMEDRLRSMDRLAALGRFTAAIAHEIRNPLGGVAAGVQYLERHLENEPSQLENVRFIQKEIDRLNRIIEDLFQVTHPQPIRKTPVPPAQLVDQAIRCLGPQPGDQDVRIEVDCPVDLPPVPVDPDQIEQVLLNLIKNAVEATPRGGTVETHVYASGQAEGRRMVFQVIDRGPGIDAESRTRVFEPFYTKGKAKGTGLGLYVSHGIAQRHGGEIHVASPESGGAVFTVTLPLSTVDATETLS